MGLQLRPNFSKSPDDRAMPYINFPSDPAVSVDDVHSFLTLSEALGLTQAEQLTLLDISRAELVTLHVEPDQALERGGAKLRRRLSYAMTLLVRMKSALEC